MWVSRRLASLAWPLRKRRSSSRKSHAAHDWPAARGLEQKYMPLLEANFWESNPGPVKTLLSRMGRCSQTLRLPLVPPSESTQRRLEQLATELGLLPA